MPTKKLCKNCSIDISHRHPNSKFCSKSCKDKYKYTSGAITTASQYKKISG